MNALYQLKRNLSQKSHWTTWLNAYTGYVVPILTYASSLNAKQNKYGATRAYRKKLQVDLILKHRIQRKKSATAKSIIIPILACPKWIGGIVRLWGDNTYPISGHDHTAHE